MKAMPSFSLNGLKKNPSLIPLFICVGAGGIWAAYYMARLALRNPDVSWNRKTNPEPWQEYDKKQYKFLVKGGAAPPLCIAFCAHLPEPHSFVSKRYSKDMHQNSSSNISSANELVYKYYPEGPSFWMYAMITIGCAFIAFVVITMSTICKSTLKRWRSEPNTNDFRKTARTLGPNSLMPFDEESSFSRTTVEIQ